MMQKHTKKTIWQVVVHYPAGWRVSYFRAVSPHIGSLPDFGTVSRNSWREHSIWNIWKFAQEQFHQYHFFELTFFFIAVGDLKYGKLKIQALQIFSAFFYCHQILPNQKAQKFRQRKNFTNFTVPLRTLPETGGDHDHGQRDGTHLETYVSCGAVRSTRHLDGGMFF